MDQCMSTFALKTYQALIFPRKVNKQINTIDNKGIGDAGSTADFRIL